MEASYSNLKEIRLTNTDAANFNAQYPTLTVKKTQVFHDRFIMACAVSLVSIYMKTSKKLTGIGL